MKKWLKIEITTHPLLVDSITDFLIGIYDGGVEVAAERPDELASVHFFFAEADLAEIEREKAIADIQIQCKELSHIFGTEIPHIQWEVIDDQDWAANWKRYFSPFFLTENVVIVPSWQEYVPKNREKTIVMDPGMAFGTGHHPTTALAAAFIEEGLKNGKNRRSVLDVGTGTGVLAMIAALNGAKKVLAVDNDPVAVGVALENVEKNGFTKQITVSSEQISGIVGTFDYVIANIIHDVILDLHGDLCRLAGDSGKLILSGILAGKQSTSVQKAFERAGYTLQEERKLDEWVALVLSR